MGLFSNPTPYSKQVYSTIKKEVLLRGHPFIDDVFPPDTQALYWSGKSVSGVAWMRPNDIYEGPIFHYEKDHAHDFDEGSLGTTWMVSAVSCLSNVPDIWHKIVPGVDEQEFDPKHSDKYTGIHHFRFWRFGEWVDVVVDDLLPTHNCELLYCHSTKRKDLWSSLLEKAYAKLNGSYEALQTGELAEALEDFTGGVTETIDITRNNLGSNDVKRTVTFDNLRHDLHTRRSLIAAKIENSSATSCSLTLPPPTIDVGTLPPPTTQEEEVEFNSTIVNNQSDFFPSEDFNPTFDSDATHVAKVKGATNKNNSAKDKRSSKGHSFKVDRDYGVTGIKIFEFLDNHYRLKFGYSEKQMIRIRNPWGGRLWNGAFSPGSPEVEALDPQDKIRLSLTAKDESEFWMPFEDFCKMFTKVIVCRVVNTSFFSTSKTWHEHKFQSAWEAPERHGGGIAEHKATFLNNPQFRFDIESHQPQECLFQLTQKALEGSKTHRVTIGFSLYAVEHNRKYRIHREQHLVETSKFLHKRSVFMRRKLALGRYLVVVCTQTPDQDGGFLFRVYTDTDGTSSAVTLDQPKTSLADLCGCAQLCSYNQLATKVIVKKADCLEPPEVLTYVVIRCEKSTFKSHKLHTPNPEWNFGSLIYRKQPYTEPILIQIFNATPILHVCIAQIEIAANREEYEAEYELGLLDENNDTISGKIWLQISSSRNMVDM